MKFSHKLLAFALLLCVVFAFAATSAMAAACDHDYDEVAVLRKGSCTVKQITKVQCSKCDDVQYVTEYVHGATVTEYTEAECETNIFVIEVCTLCNGKVREIELEGTALEHDEYIINNSTAGYGIPKCGSGETGKIKMGCHLCDAEWDKPVEALTTHKYPEKAKTVKTPTCKEPAGELYYCEVCGYLSTAKSTITKEQLSHEWEDKSVAATCSETGISNLYICKNCDVVDEKRSGTEVKVNPENHKADSIELIDDSLKPATCTTTGVGKYMCLDCEATFYGVIAASHDFDYENAKTIEAATCGADGKAEASCKVCGETDEVVLKATGEHPAFEYGYVEGKDCKTLAKAGEFCVVCEALKPDTKYTTVPGAYGPHKIEMVEGSLVEATCEADGSFDVICTVCKKDETKATEIIEKLNHAYGPEHHAEATCDHPEAIIKVCANCNNVEVLYTNPEWDAQLEHNHVQEVVPGTCVTKGYTHWVCTKCGDTKDKVEGAIDKNNHANKKVVDTLKEATCTTNGIGTYYCPDCKKDLGYQVIKAGHKLDKANEVITPATCKEDGKIVNTCTVCNEVVEEKIDATGLHIEKEGHYVPATCAKLAYTVTICEVCGDELGDKAEIAETLIPHTVSIIRYTHEEATCTEEGLADIYCAVCDQEILGYVLPKVAHKYGEAFIREANCESAEAIVQVCAACNGELIIEVIGEEKGDHDYETKNKLYTCDGTEGFEGKKVCKVCGKTTGGKKIAYDAANVKHDPVLADVLKVATCTDKGIGKYECSNPNCKEAEYRVTGVQHALDEGTVITPANCGKTGTIEYHCTLCDYTEAGTLPKVGEHKYKDMVKGPFCGVDAKVGTYCEVCLTRKSGTTETTIADTALEHEYELTATKTPATCTESGLGSAVCKYCKNEIKDTYVIAALDHDPVQGELVEATCTHGLGYQMSCSRCEVTWIDELDSKKERHNIVTKDIPATCSTNAIKGARVCSECPYVYRAGTEVPDSKDTSIKGHDVEIESILTEATCTKEGIAKYGKCSICNQTIGYKPYKAAHDWSDEQYGTGADAVVYKACKVCGEIEIVYEDETDCDHKFVEVEAVEPTEGKPGNTAGKKCSECGLILTGCEVLPWNDCEHKNVNEAVLVPGSVVEATCETDGSYEMVVTCKDCPEEVSRETVIIPAAHKGLVELPAVDATCTTTGLTAGSKCTVCGKTVVAQTVVQVADHKAVEIPAVAADCLNAGLTVGSKCEVCGTTLTAQTVVPATGHTEVELPAVAPTCEEAGKTAGIECSVCKVVLKVQEEVPALGHTEVEVAAVAPTCTETGLTAGTKCSVCGVAMKAQEEVPALGHKEEVIAAVAPTCTEAGKTEGTKCSVCGEIVKAQEAVEALGHKEEVVAGKAATCTEAGLTDGAKCTVCGETTKEQEEIAALGHKEVVVVAVAPTCTESGLTEGKKCEVCGHVIVAQEAIEALGHKYVVTWDFNADFTKKVKITTCEACDFEDFEEFDLDF